MTVTPIPGPRFLLRVGALLLVVSAASACSFVPDWANPGVWINGSSPKAADHSADPQASDNGQTPDLAAIPDKPNAPSTSDEQKSVSDTLATDRSNAQYSADALRGGTEAAAAPPEAASQSVEDVSTGDQSSGSVAQATPPAAPTPAAAPVPITSAPGTLPDGSADAAPAPQPAAPERTASETSPPAVPEEEAAVPALPGSQTVAEEAPPPAESESSNSELPNAAPEPRVAAAPSPLTAGTLPVESELPEAAPTEIPPRVAAQVPPAAEPVPSVETAPLEQPAPAAPSRAAAQPRTQMASLEPRQPPAAPVEQPAVPASGGAVAAPQTVSDSALGFRPSSAPPLAAGVAQFVPQPIVRRYQQTAALGANVATTTQTAITSTPSAQGGSRKSSTRAVGGPETMSGAVVADFGALQSASVAPSIMTNSLGSSPAAVVFFPGDTTVLSAAAKAQVRAAARTFRSLGGKGYIRVVGHSSSRTANMSLARHLVWNFERSQARANAVARELIRAGVPSEKVLVEAVGDTQPVYYESMPQGEDGNRRAEIFIQS